MFLWRNLKSSTVAAAAEALARGRATPVPHKEAPAAEGGQDAAKGAPAPTQPER